MKYLISHTYRLFAPITIPLLSLLSEPIPALAEYSGLGKETVSAETIQKFLPTPLDPQVERRIQNMLDIRSPNSGLISSDGKNLFFGWGVTGTSQIWKLDGPRRFPIQLTGGSDNTYLRGITPNNKWLIVSRDANGEENPGLYIMSTQGGPLIEIQKKPKVQTIPEFTSDDSQWLYYSANDIQPDSYAIYRYNFITQKKELLFKEPGIWHIADFKNENEILLSKSTGSRWREFSTYNLKTKELAPLLGQNEKEEYHVQFSAKAGEYFVQTNKFSDFRRLYLYKDGKFNAILPEQPHDVEEFFLDHPRKRIYYMVNDNGYFKAFVKDAKSPKDISPRLPKGIHTFFGHTTRDGRFISVAIETARAPQTSYIYDWRNKKLTQWVIPSSPEINTSKFVEDTLESYPARDGTPIPMFVKRPLQCIKKTCPVIVDFHGGPEGQATPGFSPIKQFFIEAGFVFVMPNVRGSDGYGKAWLNADDGAKRLQVITDIEDCSKYIRKAWAYDGKTPKIGVMGSSYGGYSSLMAMTYFAGAYDAGVAIVGISNLITFLKNTAPYRRLLRSSEYGDIEKDKEVLEKLSPIHYIDRAKAPLLIIQGVNDPRVPVGEALQIYKQLQSRHVPVSMILFGDEGHGAYKRDNRAQEFGHTLEFFQKYLAE